MNYVIALAAEYPAPSSVLEEVAMAGTGDQAAALSFSCTRLPDADRRPYLLVSNHGWLAEHGRPYVQGLACLSGLHGRAPLLVLARKADEALWAMEQALRSGAVAGAIGMVDRPSFTQTRRLDFAAREGGSVCVLLRRSSDGLSAARRRWRISRLPSAGTAALGGARLLAELVRRRDGPPGGTWLLEKEDATDRFRLADRLADHGLVAYGRTAAA